MASCELDVSCTVERGLDSGGASKPDQSLNIWNVGTSAGSLFFWSDKTKLELIGLMDAAHVWKKGSGRV